MISQHKKRRKWATLVSLDNDGNKKKEQLSWQQNPMQLTEKCCKVCFFLRCLTKAWGSELTCLSLCFQRGFLDTHSSSTFLSVAHNSTAIAIAYWIVWILISQSSSSATISSVLPWDRYIFSGRVMCLALRYAFSYSCPSWNPCATNLAVLV